MMARKKWKVSEPDTKEQKPIAFSYRRSDGTINLHVFKAEYLNTPEECAIVMGELDKLRGEFETKVRDMRTKAYKESDFAPPEIFHATMNLWNMAKIARNRVQDRRGQLRRGIALMRSDVHNANRERCFVNAAKQILSKEKYLSIWKLVDETNATNKTGSYRE